jgi:hypothetical protein
VVGPEAPLAAGVVDAFRAAGLKVFGPTQAAAQLESSKDFAKQFMDRHNIPTAAFATFTDAAAAHAYLDAQGAPIVIKADGLAAGKGVVVATTLEEAHAAVDMMLADNSFGAAGARVVIEECLFGEEASFIVMVDGEHVLPLATSQDHKRLLDGDLGPNTGGMGAYSPAPVVTPEIHAKALREVIRPVVAGMKAEGVPFTGFLYAGLMISPEGQIKVLEFNCRMGDPETQPIMMRLKSDLVTLLEAAVEGKLDQVEAEWDRRFAFGVVMAAATIRTIRARAMRSAAWAMPGRTRACIPRRHHSAGRSGGHRRRSRAVRHRARRHHQDGADPGLSSGRKHRFRRSPDARRHRLARHRAQEKISIHGVWKSAELPPLLTPLPDIRRLRAYLKRGGVIAYATESCYGLGCDPANRRAVQHILQAETTAVTQGPDPDRRQSGPVPPLS